MKFIFPTILTTTTIASAAVLQPALPLDLLSNPTLSSQSSVSTLVPSLLEAPSSNLSLLPSNLPDSRFRVRIDISAPLLPINAALVNILYFMSIVAGQDFMRELQPRSYSTLGYRDVQITSYAWTEARFLLWGMYYAAIDMVKLARFNDLKLEVYWEKRLAGMVRISGKRALNLAGEAGNLTLDHEDRYAQTNLIGSGRDIVQSEDVIGNMTGSDLAFSHINASSTLSLSSSFDISFESIAGAGPVDRNDVFLTFYSALLHVAQFPAENWMQSFQSDSPSGKLHLHMQEIGIGCPYGRVIGALLFVPRYMMEHSSFGYRETDFVVKLGGEPACLGTILQGRLPAERRSLKESHVG